MDPSVPEFFAKAGVRFVDMGTPDYKATDSTCLYCDEVIEESRRENHAWTKAHKRSRSCILEWWKQCSTEGWKLVCEHIQIRSPSFHCEICNESGDWYTSFEHRERKSHKAHRVDYEATAVKATFAKQLEAHKISCQAISTAQVDSMISLSTAQVNSMKSCCPTVISTQDALGRRLEIGGDVVFLGEVQGLSALTVVSNKGLSRANEIKRNLLTDFETRLLSTDPTGVQYVRHISKFPDGYSVIGQATNQMMSSRAAVLIGSAAALARGAPEVYAESYPEVHQLAAALRKL